MPQRAPNPETVDETPVEAEAPTVGERLKAAREKQKMNLEDIAAQTRIPQRHLEALERSDWDSLPAPTYTTGFAKSYASAVGLDRTDIGDQLRAEMGGQRFTANTLESFEPVHWYEAARSAQASAAPYCVGVKNGFVVTWLTNTNFHFGVSGKSPTPLPDLLVSLLLSAEQADSKAAAAAEALSIPAPLNSRRLASPFRLSVSTASSTCGSIFFMITPARSAHAARYFERRSALLVGLNVELA